MLVLTNSRPYVNSVDKKLPLKAVSIVGYFVDCMGQVRIGQSFTNDYDCPQNVTYVFSLSSGTVITDFKLTTEEKTLIGIIKEKSQARADFNTAVQSGHKTAIVEAIGNNTYKVEVGLIKPHENVVIEITTVMLVEPTLSGGLKFVVPTNIAPIYNGSAFEMPQDRLYKTDMSKMKYTTDVDYKFNIEICWTSKNKLLEITSLTNDVQMTRTSDYQVHVFSETSPKNGDFNLIVKTDLNPTLYHYKDDETDNRYVSALYQFNDTEDMKYPKDFIFVLDRSGSMEGPKIEQAKHALKLFVRSLPANSVFNIVSFGSTHTFMWKQSQKYTDESMNECLLEVDKFGANMGGTEIYECLKNIMKTQNSDFEKVIVVLTDGQVSNTNMIVDYLKSNKSHTRVFSVGIGKNASRDLVEKMASASNGMSAMIVDEKELDSTVITMLANAQKTYYSDIEVTFDGEIFEHSDKSLYSGQYLPIFAKLSQEKFSKLTTTPITIKGTPCRSNTPKYWYLKINDSKEAPNYLRQLYAQNKISKLTDRDEIVQLSKDYHVMNEYTSFILVDESEVITGNAVNVSVPHVAGGVRLMGLSELSEVRGVMVDNIDRVLERGERLDTLGVVTRMNRHGCQVQSLSGDLCSQEKSFGYQFERQGCQLEKCEERTRCSSVISRKSSCCCCGSFFSRLFKCFKRRPQSIQVSNPSPQKTTKTITSPVLKHNPDSVLNSVSNSRPANSVGVRITTINTTSSTNVNTLITFKQANGSFRMTSDSCKLIGFDNTKSDYEFNCAVRDYLLSLNDIKYTMILDALTKWIDANRPEST